MRVQQNQNSQPNFGLRIVRTKEFEKFSASHGWEVQLKRMEALLEKHHPNNRDIFELSPHLVFAHKENDFFGPTYHFNEGGKKFESPKDIERAIIATIKAREELKKISGYVSELNQKFGINLDFNSRNICDVVGNNVKRVKTTLTGVAKGIATIPAHQRRKYSTRMYNGGSTNIMTLKIKRGSDYSIADFIFGVAKSRDENEISRITQTTITSLKERQIQMVQSQRKRKNAARTNH